MVQVVIMEEVLHNFLPVFPLTNALNIFLLLQTAFTIIMSVMVAQFPPKFVSSNKHLLLFFFFNFYCCTVHFDNIKILFTNSHTQHGTQYTHHSLKYLLPQHHNSYNDVFYWSIPQYCSFSKAQHTLPEDGPIGLKHVGANIEIF